MNIDEVKSVKKLIKRQPIDEDTIQHLLENSNFTCCICKGTKSDSYIIHHIYPYSTSQDNQYFNLAVLCLNDHELAHKEGVSLTLKLTPEQILKTKTKWEKEVQEIKVYKASVNGEIHEVEFLNIPRILEAYKEIFKKIPKTQYSAELIDNNLLHNDGYLNIDKINNIADNPHTPLIFFALYGSAMLRFHYFEIFKKLLQRLDFKDLDKLLNKTAIKAGIVGEYCFYVGGLYSTKLPSAINSEMNMITFFIKKKPFIVEWVVDPHYFASNSAKHRTSHRNVYTIYGKIMNVNFTNLEGKSQIVVDLRPYCFGLPFEKKNRTPDIAYQKRIDDVFDELDWAE